MHISNDSEIAHAVPLEERLRLPNNEPAPPQSQERDLRAIDPRLVEILQKPYEDGLKKDKPAEYIPYGPSGFMVDIVLAGNLAEVSGADEGLPTLDARAWPVKTAFHFEFCDAAYNEAVHTKQRRVPSTRGEFAILAADEVKKMLAKLPNFPYTLDQIKIVGIDVRSRGTVQPRLFVAAESLDVQDRLSGDVKLVAMQYSPISLMF